LITKKIVTRSIIRPTYQNYCLILAFSAEIINFYEMNDLYLIGNGFDLAHGLKTSYNDFLLWYLNRFLKQFGQKDHYEDDLMKIDRMGVNYRFPEKFDTIPSVLQFLKENNYKRKAHHDFF
jgi:hypothetical protein